MTTQPLPRSSGQSGPSRAEYATGRPISRTRETGGTTRDHFETLLTSGTQSKIAAETSTPETGSSSSAQASEIPERSADVAATNPFAQTSKIRWIPAQPQPATPAAPTAESVFGPNPWVENPEGQGPNGTKWSFNPQYFATLETAQKVAEMFGGKVVQQNSILPSGPMVQLQPNQLVELPNGRLINPGFIAGFYTHGYPQSYVDQLVAAEVAGGPDA